MAKRESEVVLPKKVTTRPHGESEQPLHISTDKSATKSNINTQGIKRALESASDPNPRPRPPPTPTLSDSGSHHAPHYPDATPNLLLSDLSWWTSEDEVRAWVHAALPDNEDSLLNITFSEHKQNGKSKGQAFCEFISAQAASKVKRHIDDVVNLNRMSEADIVVKPCIAIFSQTANPFRLIHKDSSMRKDNKRTIREGSLEPYSDPPQPSPIALRGNYRGGRGTHRGRGAPQIIYPQPQNFVPYHAGHPFALGRSSHPPYTFQPPFNPMINNAMLNMNGMPNLAPTMPPPRYQSMADPIPYLNNPVPPYGPLNNAASKRQRQD